jgi:hypothetical protein
MASGNRPTPFLRFMFWLAMAAVAVALYLAWKGSS